MSGVSESEKNRYNSNFEILQGEELKAEEVLKAIEVIKQNIVDLQIVSDKQLKIQIGKESNDELVKNLENFIEKSSSKTYNLQVEYDDETGLVNYMVLTMLEEKT